MQAEKSQIRQEIAQRRLRLDASQCRDGSMRIAAQCIAAPEFLRATTLTLYASTSGEVDTTAIFVAAVAAGKVVFYPRLDMSSDRLSFHRVRQFTELQEGYRGIREPASHADAAPESFDVIVVPGVAFDAYGHRLGRGGGHFDRWLEHVRGCRVGLAFECQIVPELVCETHDQRMDLLVTEQRILRFREENE